MANLSMRKNQRRTKRRKKDMIDPVFVVPRRRLYLGCYMLWEDINDNWILIVILNFFPVTIFVKFTLTFLE